MCVPISIPSTMVTNTAMLQERAGMLGNTHHQSKPGHVQKLLKTPSHRDIDLQQFKQKLLDIPPPTITTTSTDPEQLPDKLESMWHTIRDTAVTCRKSIVDAVQRPHWDHTRPQWARILDTKDPKTIWKSLNWKGTFDDIEENQPSENLFKKSL